MYEPFTDPDSNKPNVKGHFWDNQRKLNNLMGIRWYNYCTVYFARYDYAMTVMYFLTF